MTLESRALGLKSRSDDHQTELCLGIPTLFSRQQSLVIVHYNYIRIWKVNCYILLTTLEFNNFCSEKYIAAWRTHHFRPNNLRLFHLMTLRELMPHCKQSCVGVDSVDGELNEYARSQIHATETVIISPNSYKDVQNGGQTMTVSTLMKNKFFFILNQPQLL